MKVGQVHLTAPQFVELVDTGLYSGVEGGADGQGNERFLNIKTRLAALQYFLLEAGDRFYDYWGEQVNGIWEPGQGFDSVQYRGGSCMEEGGVFASNQAP